MNRNESKYFNTAVKMDVAFLHLLEEKDFAYVTIKELCKAAGVNRSTFYLHYQNLDELLAESVQYLNEEFITHMSAHVGMIHKSIPQADTDSLYLVTSQYLQPYLEFIRDNKRIFSVALTNAHVLRLNDSYRGLSEHVLMPILDRFNIPESRREYIVAFYIQGIMAIVTRWLKNDCREDIEFVIDIIQQCVKRPHAELNTGQNVE